MPLGINLPKESESFFSITQTSTAAGLYILKEAPTAGQSYYITGFDISHTVDADHNFILLRNTCLKLDATADTVTVSDNSALEMGTKDFALSFWVKTSDVSVPYLIKKRVVAGPGDGYNVEITAAGKIKVTLEDTDNDEVTLTSASAINNNVWRHIYIAADRSSDTGLSIYIDGTLDAAIDQGFSSVDESISGSDQNLIITGVDSKTVYLSGLALFVATDMSAVFATDLATLYNDGKGYKLKGTETNLVFGLNLDDCKSGYAYDIVTTTGNNGTLSGASSAVYSPMKESRNDLDTLGPFNCAADSGRSFTFPHAVKVGRSNPLAIVVSALVDITLFGYTDSAA